MRKSTLFAVDAVALIAFALASLPNASGIDAHEWIGLAVPAAFIAHVAANAARAARLARVTDAGSFVRRATLAIDAFAVAACMTCAVSGLMISGSVLQSLGLYASGYYFWNPLHAVSAKVLLSLLLVHLALHGREIAQRFKLDRKDGSHADA